MENSWYKHSPSDWLAGRISRKSFELQGAFIHICQLYWVKHGHFTAHQASLEIGATLLVQLMEAEIIKEEGEQIRIEFLDLQMADLDRLSQRRSEAGRKGGENKAQGIVKQDVASAKQMVASAKQNEADKIRLDEIREDKIEIQEKKKNTCVLFDQFWALYPRKTSKQSASKAFAKLKDEDQQKAISNIGRLYSQTPIQFVPHAATYLNQARWDDQVIPRNSTFNPLNQTDDEPLPSYR